MIKSILNSIIRHVDEKHVLTLYEINDKYDFHHRVLLNIELTPEKIHILKNDLNEILAMLENK